MAALCAPTLSCFHCEKNIPASNFDLHTAHCKRNLERCEICGEMVAKIQAAEHFEEFHAPMRCTLCNEIIERDLFILHQNENCAQRILVCRFCEFPLAAIDLDAHVSHCGNRTEMCIPCGKYVRLCEKSAHDIQHLGSDLDQGNMSPSNDSQANHADNDSKHRVWVTVAITGIAVLIGTFLFQRRDYSRDGNR